jgi:hypothetical protein
MASVAGKYGGVVEIEGNLYSADVDNQIGDEIEGWSTATVEVDVDQAVSGKFTATLNEFRDLTAYATFIAPFLTVRYRTTDDPLGTGGYGEIVTTRHQCGLYTLLPMPREFRGGKVIQTVTAWDLTWLLSQRYSQGSVTLSVGTKVVQYVRDRLNALGFTRHSIQDSDHGLTKEMIWQDGTSWIAVLNDLLEAIGYYKLWASRTGRLTSRPYRHISSVEEQVTFSTRFGDIGRTVTLEPEQEYIKNHVIVYGNSPGDTPIVGSATNTDRNHPTSIYSLRSDGDQPPVYLTLTEDDPDIESQAVATSRARKLLEERSSMFYRLQIETIPYPALDQREPIRLYIETDRGIEVANEKWWWDHMTLGFTPKQGGMKLRCNRLLGFEWEES